MPANCCGDRGHLFVGNVIIGHDGLESPHRGRHQGHCGDQDGEKHENGPHAGDHEHGAEFEQAFFHDVPGLQIGSGQLYWIELIEKATNLFMQPGSDSDRAQPRSFVLPLLLLFAWSIHAGAEEPAISQGTEVIVPEPVPKDEDLEAAGAVIGNIVLEKRNIFELSDPKENKWL